MPPKANGAEVPTPDDDNTTEHDDAAAPDAATMPNVPLHQVLRMMGEKKAFKTPPLTMFNGEKDKWRNWVIKLKNHCREMDKRLKIYCSKLRQQL